MSKRSPTHPGQFGFDDLLAQADVDNTARRIEQEGEHLPSDYPKAIAFLRGLIERHHAAMLAADIEEAMRLREEAHKLAVRLNGGQPGILAHRDAPGNVLARETAAPPGTVPLWGQEGQFVLTIGSMQVQIEMRGLFGTGSAFCVWPGFAAHAVDLDRPFLSSTGYRNFVGVHAEVRPGVTPDTFARDVVAAYVSRELKGKLVAITSRS